MAIVGTARGTGSGGALPSSPDTTATVAPSANFAAGSWGVLRISYDNSGALGIDPFVSCTDTKGNVWTSRVAGLYDPAGANEGICVRIFTTNQGIGTLTTGDTITVTVAPGVAYAITLMEVTGTNLAYVTGGVNTGANTASPSVTTPSIASGHAIFGAGAAEFTGDWTGDADTLNGTWSTQVTLGTSDNGDGDVCITTQHKIVNAAGAQTYNPTISPAADCILAWIELEEAAGGQAPRSMNQFRKRRAA